MNSRTYAQRNVKFLFSLIAADAYLEAAMKLHGSFAEYI